MEIRLPEPAVQQVIAEVLANTSNATLAHQLETLAATTKGARQVTEATVVIASTLLLAKTAMPHNSTRFAAIVKSEMTVIRPHPTLVELAIALIEAETATVDDLFRDRRLVTDSMFEQRLETIKQALRH